jgi:hypothetical protein
MAVSYPSKNLIFLENWRALLPAVWLGVVAPRKAFFLFYLTNLGNKPELSFINNEPELLPIAMLSVVFIIRLFFFSSPFARVKFSLLQFFYLK